MRNTKPGKEWDAANEHRKSQIIWLLNEGDKGFTELHKKLRTTENKGWSKSTLSICLSDLLDKEHSIQKKPKGKRWVNSLVRSNPLVAERLKKKPQVDANLLQVDEKGFIASWRNSLDFAFITLLNDSIGVAHWRGEKEAHAEQILQSDIANFVELLNIYDTALVERIRLGTLKVRKLRAIQQKIHAKIKAHEENQKNEKKK